VYLYGVFVYSQSVDILRFLINSSILVLINSILSFFIYPILLKINLSLELDRNIF